MDKIHELSKIDELETRIKILELQVGELKKNGVIRYVPYPVCPSQPCNPSPYYPPTYMC